MTAGGSRLADVAIDGGRITAIEPDLSGLAAGADEVDRRDRAARPPRCRRRPHAHAGRVGRRAGSVLPGFGGGGVRRHDDLPVVQQPGHGIVARGRALAADRRPRMARRHRRRLARSTVGLSLAVSGHCDDPLAELPATIEAGVATSKAFMVFDFRLPDARAVRRDGGHEPPRRDAPGPLRGPGAARRRRQRGAGAWRRRASLPRDDATELCRGRGDGPGAGVRADGGRAGPRRPPLVGGGARRGPPRQGGRRSRLGRDLPALPRADRGALRRPRSGLAAPASSSRRRSAPRPTATRCGRASPTARSTSSPPTTSPTASASRRPRPRHGVSFDQISNGAPGIETLLDDRLQRRRRQGPDHARADGRPAGDDARRALRARAQGRDRGRPRRRHRRCSTRPRAGRSAPPTSITRATTRRTRASRSRARSATSSSVVATSSGTAPSSAAAAPAPSSSACGRRADAGWGSATRAGPRTPVYSPSGCVPQSAPVESRGTPGRGRCRRGAWCRSPPHRRIS